MPRASNGREPRGHAQQHDVIKQDPEALVDSASPTSSGTTKGDPGPVSSNYFIPGQSTGFPSVARSFYLRQGRSDAPTPSELQPESEPPLLREVRMPNGVVSAGGALPESPISLDPGESFFHGSFQDIGKKLKACNDTLGELQQLGVSHDVQLPELVLVGDQSAGKSSLMSGLASLDLPRSEGTCTRCPLHIRVSRNSDWSCRVGLRREFSYKPPEGRAILESDVTDQDPFFPWKRLPATHVHEFKTMLDSGEIEKVLRWAQIAILNDDKPFEQFIPGSGATAQNVTVDMASESVNAKFSPNIVTLEIKGPDMPDLSFYDMPGIFQNPADARDDYLVSVVKNLSKAYINHPSAIILCSMPMNSDAENSATFGLIRKLGALSRTIGVLTKADLLPQGGNHDQWTAIMNEQAHRTGLGYFITSRPHDKDLDALKEWEMAYFDNHTVDGWPADFHGFAGRCGVEKLKAFLSERLGAEFAKSLPTIKQKVTKYLDRVNAQLRQLPELPDNVEMVIRTSIMKFGELARSGLSQDKFSCGDLPDNFRQCLLDMKPKFTLKDASDHPAIEISDDESDAGSTAPSAATTPTAKRRMPPPAGTPSNKRPRMDNQYMASVKPEDTRSISSARPSPAPRNRPQFPPPFTQFSHVGRGFRTLAQVRSDVRLKTRTGVPDVIPDGVYNDLCKEAIAPWDGPMKAFLGQIMNMLHNMLDMALRQSFESLKKRLIYQECGRLLREFLEGKRRETLDFLRVCYNMEIYGLFTINREAFDQYRKDEGITLTRFRHQMRMNALGYSDKNSPVPWESLTEEKRVQDEKRREQEIIKIGIDPFHREMEVVKYVRAYYRLAALRFADTVAQHVTNGLVPGIQEYIPFYLDDKLGLREFNAVATFERLMAEDDATATKREVLKAEAEKFVKALESIAALEAGTGGTSPPQSQYEAQDDALMSGALHDDEV